MAGANQNMPEQTRKDISVIIPAYNEALFIGDTLAALNRELHTFDYEIIVVDNGSSDDTATIARQLGAKVCTKETGTIASLRNTGVDQSSGKLLVFIDADVNVRPEWGQHLQVQYDKLSHDTRLVTGSRCLPPDEQHWLNKYWFSLLSDENSAYINSGHLICTRSLFDQIGGFSEQLRTAEDHDFCMKAKEAGAKILADKDLKVFHYGYPATAKEFVARERWHGRQDFSDFRSMASSKVAIIVFAHLFILIASLLLASQNVVLAIPGYLLFNAVLFPLLSYLKFRKNIRWRSLIQTSAVFYLYIFGRTLALFDQLFAKKTSKRQR